MIRRRGQNPSCHRLLGQGKHPGNHGLGCNDSSDGGQGDQGIEKRPGNQAVERTERQLGMIQEKGSLAEIIEKQGGESHPQPGELDGRGSKMPHVRVQGLSPRDAEDHRTQDHHSVQAVLSEELEGMQGIDGGQDVRISENFLEPQGRDGENQRIMTGPKTRPMTMVPRCCTMKRTKRIPQVMGTTTGASAWVATSSPSTDERTEMEE